MKRLLLSLFTAVLFVSCFAAAAFGAVDSYFMDEKVNISDFTYKIVSAERKKDDPKTDVYDVKLSVTNNGFESLEVPKVKVVETSGKEYNCNEALPKLEKGASALVPMSFNIPKGAGEYRLKVSGDTGLATAAFIQMTPKVSDSYNELLDACAKGDAKKVKELVGKGAKVSAKNSKSETALILASRAGCAEAVTFLLDKGAYIKDCDFNYETPIMAAVHSKNIETVRVLLKRGAETDKKNFLGKTPLQIAYDEGDEAIIELVRSYTAKPAKRY